MVTTPVHDSWVDPDHRAIPLDMYSWRTAFQDVDKDAKRVRANTPKIAYFFLLCSPVQVKVGVKDNQTTNTKVTAIMRDMGPQNYSEFNEPVFCNEAVLWAVD